MSQWSAQAYRFLETILPVRVESLSYEPLSSSHIPHFAKSTADHLLQQLGIPSVAGSKIVERALCLAGTAGLLSRFVKGQGMLVVMRKTGDADRSATAAKRLSRSLLANLGCGDRWHPDWRNFDLVPSSPSIEAMDLLADWDLPEHSFEVVYSSHVLEHLPRSLAPSFLRNCWKILRPGGILRLVVPDLQGICREYLAQLDAAQTGTPGADRKLRWMTLELLDQMVRTRSGGLMARLWASEPLPEKDFIVSRFGEGAKFWIEKLQQSAPISATSENLFEGFPNASVTEAANFRQQGEIHQWMYDAFSLSELLQQCGFVQVAKVDAQTSAIPNFANFHLDSNPEGFPRKPDSLYLEARKIGTSP
jgi:SAM-dependent methyltransferase